MSAWASVSAPAVGFGDGLGDGLAAGLAAAAGVVVAVVAAEVGPAAGAEAEAEAEVANQTVAKDARTAPDTIACTPAVQQATAAAENTGAIPDRGGLAGECGRPRAASMTMSCSSPWCYYLDQRRRAEPADVRPAPTCGGSTTRALVSTCPLRGFAPSRPPRRGLPSPSRLLRGCRRLPDSPSAASAGACGGFGQARR